MDLHQYMQKHPHLKLDQIMNLSVASATFRKYLEDGLRKAAYRDKLAREGVPASAMLVQKAVVAATAMLKARVALLPKVNCTCLPHHTRPQATQVSSGLHCCGSDRMRSCERVTTLCAFTRNRW